MDSSLKRKQRWRFLLKGIRYLEKPPGLHLLFEKGKPKGPRYVLIRKIFVHGLHPIIEVAKSFSCFFL